MSAQPIFAQRVFPKRPVKAGLFYCGPTVFVWLPPKRSYTMKTQTIKHEVREMKALLKTSGQLMDIVRRKLDFLPEDIVDPVSTSVETDKGGAVLREE